MVGAIEKQREEKTERQWRKGGREGEEEGEKKGGSERGRGWKTEREGNPRIKCVCVCVRGLSVERDLYSFTLLLPPVIAP